MDLQEQIRGFIALLAVVNPIGTITVFLGTTSIQLPDQKARTARTATITMIVTLLAAAWIGEALLQSLGISVPAFRMSGGLLFLLMAISMLQGREEETKHAPGEAEDALESGSIGVVPLGIPFLAGPGALALVIVEAHKSTGWTPVVFTSLNIVAVGLVAWLSLRLAGRIGGLLGQTGINVVTRLMGLLLAAIGIEFIAGGAVELFPGLR
jgi:multiple antibiotic resistance protein